MRYRRFGRTGWSVSEIGYGMWGMGGWSGSDDEESQRSLQRAVDLGCNFFDTAWAYGEGRSESLLGQLVRANPDKKLYTASKIPPKNRKWPSQRGFTLDDTFPPEHIEEYVHSSLRNSGLESFDLIEENDEGLIVDRTIAFRPMPAARLFRDAMRAAMGSSIPDDFWEYSD